MELTTPKTAIVDTKQIQGLVLERNLLRNTVNEIEALCTQYYNNPSRDLLNVILQVIKKCDKDISKSTKEKDNGRT